MTVQLQPMPNINLMSTAQLSELALDAAIEVEEFISGRGKQLAKSKRLISTIIDTLNFGVENEHEGKLDLAYLPIYHSAVDSEAGSRPNKVGEFRNKVKDILTRFASADHGDPELLPRLREFCLSVHDQALSQRLDAIRSNKPQASYASRPF